ncbi:transglycosylase domain-containing protein [Bdellovibrionota bacterium FG-1]
MTKRTKAITGTVSVMLCVILAFYVGSLYRQLKKAFLQQDQFIPTRIYSDVLHLAPSQIRGSIEERLVSLGYLTKGSPLSETVSFSLHPLDYPPYLIPDNHPVLDAAGKGISLHFESTAPTALLHSIEISGNEVPDLYLEPELVATLTQSGPQAKKPIRAYIKFPEIPAQVWKAIIAVEDQHFLEHGGIDPRGILRALWADIRSRSFAQGGSTITLQLVKNLMARKKKNIFKKAPEFILAPLLEATFDKEQILERYLNEVYLGQVGALEVRGVAEGAELFFGKRLEELNLAEIALMAGLIRGPGFYSPYAHRPRAFERQRLVLKKMVETGQIAQAEADAASKMTVRLEPPMNQTNKAPYFSDFVKAELIRQIGDKIPEADIPQASLRVYTTLDLHVNSSAQHAVAQGVAELEKNLKLSPENRLEGALASVDPSTGFIRALVGGRSYAQSTFNRILNMKRQVGSTFKPFVYLAAFQKGNDPQGVPYSPAHPAEDTSWTVKYDHGRQEWSPKNYEKEHMSWINYRMALAHSVNTIAARLGMEVGIDKVIETARAAGIQSDLPAVPSLSLGVAELSPVELLRAYAVLANHGQQDQLTVIRAITQEDGTGFARFVYHPKQVIDPAPIDLLTDMMQTVFTEGTAKSALNMGFDRPAAGKTGTTSDHRDSWFAGFTPQLTTVVWVGQDQTPPAQDEKNEKNGKSAKGAKKKTKLHLTGATSALPIWVHFMKDALAGDPPQTFPLSPYLVDVTVDRHTGKKASSSCPIVQTLTDKFIRGHEPQDSSCEAGWPATVHETEAP